MGRFVYIQEDPYKNPETCITSSNNKSSANVLTNGLPTLHATACFSTSVSDCQHSTHETVRGVKI